MIVYDDCSHCVSAVVDPSSWPDVDSQPLSLEDSWRLRVVSAQVYSIVKSRDTKNFERVMGFLDTTYRLLPRLVRAIKHMKILFGLKTMVGIKDGAFIHRFDKHLQLFHDGFFSPYLSIQLFSGCCLLLQVIMWMLKEGKGMIDIVSKIGQFFPNKLPQYQDQCVSVRNRNWVTFYDYAKIRKLPFANY